jgi:hypothetical protein
VTRDERRVLFWIGIVVCGIAGAALSGVTGAAIGKGQPGALIGIFGWAFVVGAVMIGIAMRWNDRWKD